MVLTQNQIIYIISVGIGSVILAQLVNWVLKRGMKTFETQSKKVAILRHEPFEERATRFAIIRRLIVVAIYFIGAAMIILSLPGAKNIAISMLAGAGVFAIIIGFAVQSTFADIISGISIAYSQPYRIGDRISFQGQFGQIEDIGLRHTTIKVWTNKRLIVPNSVMAKEVIENFTIEDTKMARPLEIGVHYETDIQKAKKIMIEEARKHPETMDNRTAKEKKEEKPEYEVLMLNLGDSSITLRIVFWTKDQPTSWKTEQELRETIFERFKKNKITIPYPQRDVHMKR